jgi:CspA family cold shock protein
MAAVVIIRQSVRFMVRQSAAPGSGDRVVCVRARNLLEVCMATGFVRWFNSGKGYGFIAPNDGGEDLYAHHGAIEMQGNGYLEEGQNVEFDIETGPQGPQAANIRSLD